jgi:hypothetical protein
MDLGYGGEKNQLLARVAGWGRLLFVPLRRGSCAALVTEAVASSTYSAPSPLPTGTNPPDPQIEICDPQAGELAAGSVAAGAAVVVGCAAGVDAFFRSRFPAARVLMVDPVLGRAGFAQRSIACVEAASGGLWVSFPQGSCPPRLMPSASASRCFSGSGSGSWASLAYAKRKRDDKSFGRGGAALVYLGSVPAPAGWGLVAEGSGWWRFQPVVQMQLF